MERGSPPGLPLPEGKHMKLVDVLYADGSGEHCLADDTNGDVVDIEFHPESGGIAVIKAIEGHVHILNWNYVVRVSTSDYEPELTEEQA
jgi:hypothetical protein